MRVGFLCVCVCGVAVRLAAIHRPCRLRDRVLLRLCLKLLLRVPVCLLQNRIYSSFPRNLYGVENENDDAHAER